MPPLKKDPAQAAMVLACQHTDDNLHFRPPQIPHSVAVMVMALSFHTKDPDGVGYAISIFLFTDLSPSAGSEVGPSGKEMGCNPGGGGA